MFQLNELGNKNLLQLLQFFSMNPTQDFSYTSIRKKTKLAKATLAKWLSFLSSSNLIKMKRVGTTKLYSLNRDAIIIKYFKILNNIASLKILEETARKFDCDIYLYGSLSRGEDVENSDVDLLVIGEANEPDIVKEIKSKINRETKIQIFSRMEWSQLERRDRAFYERVERDKIKLN